MTPYKHTQIGYLMLVVTFCVLVLFAWAQITVRLEPPSADSGANFAITAIMVLVLFIVTDFHRQNKTGIMSTGAMAYTVLILLFLC
ncbi:MAG: hypothetical protein WC817_03020 [Patescibacteria group bacterium]|jgi:hypothetical protein